MAVLQAQTTNSNGYALNSLSVLGSQISLSFELFIDSLVIIKANLINAIGLPQYTLLLSSSLLNASLGQYQNYKSSLVRFFGDNVKQSGTQLIINKADIGLQELVNNTAESILVGLLLRVRQQESNSLISNVYISLFNQYIETNPKPLVVTNLILNLYVKIIYEQPSELLGDIMLNYTNTITPNQFNY